MSKAGSVQRRSVLRAAMRLVIGRSDLDSRIDRAVAVVKESQVPSYRSQLPVLSGELSRSRRYQRPMSIAVVGLQQEHLPAPLVRRDSRSTSSGRWISRLWADPSSSPSPRDDRSARLQNNDSPERPFLSRTTQMLSFAFGLILEESVRDSDFVTYVPKDDRFVLLLAESDRTQALETVKRLAALLDQRLVIHLEAGVAEFPSEGLTLDELVAHASSTVSSIVSKNGSSSPGGKR